MENAFIGLNASWNNLKYLMMTEGIVFVAFVTFIYLLVNLCVYSFTYLLITGKA